jgi:hypothetical protein
MKTFICILILLVGALLFTRNPKLWPIAVLKTLLLLSLLAVSYAGTHQASLPAPKIVLQNQAQPARAMASGKENHIKRQSPSSSQVPGFLQLQRWHYIGAALAATCVLLFYLIRYVL